MGDRVCQSESWAAASRQLEARSDARTSVIQCWPKINVINFNYIFIMTTARQRQRQRQLLMSMMHVRPLLLSPNNADITRTVWTCHRLCQLAKNPHTQKKSRKWKWERKPREKESPKCGTFSFRWRSWNIISPCCIDSPTSCMPIKLPFNFNCCCHSMPQIWKKNNQAIVKYMKFIRWEICLKLLKKKVATFWIFSKNVLKILVPHHCASACKWQPHFSIIPCYTLPESILC